MAVSARRTATLFLAFCVLLAPSGIIGAPPAGTVGEAGKTVDAYLSSLVPFGFWGAALVAVDGKVLLNQAYGWADAEHQIPNTPGTLFGLESVTKQFTAAAILALQEDGKLNINDSIARHLPGVPADKQAITIHQLLTHTAGVMTGTETRVEDMSRDGVVRAVLDSPLAFEPGTDFEYSNLGFELLAAIVEIVSGQSWDAYVQSRLFDRAGMHATGHLAGRTDGVAARWYGEEGELDDPRTWPFPDWNSYGSGGALSTTGDLFRWHQALLDDRVLSDSTRTILFTPVRRDYACGWTVRDSDHGRLIMHNGGSSLGGASVFKRYIDKDTVIIMFANRQGETMLFSERIINQVEEIVFGGAVALPPRTESFDAAERNRLAGAYTAQDGCLLLASDDDRLILRGTGQHAVDAVLGLRDDGVEHQVNAASQAMFDFFARGDTILLYDAFSTPARGTGFVRYFTRQRKNDEAQFGPLQRYVVLGTTPDWITDFADLVTYLRADYERDHRIFRLHWKDGKVAAVGGSGIPEPVRVQLLPGRDGTIVGYHIPTGHTITIRAEGSAKSIPPRLRVIHGGVFTRVEQDP